MKTRKLGRQAVLGVIRVAAVIFLALFIPVSGFSYWQGWAYFLCFMGSFSIITWYLWRFDPRLLKDRINLSEKESGQRNFQMIAGIGFLVLLIASSLDYRFALSFVSPIFVFLGFLFLLLGYALIFYVFRANSFASATIKVSDEQYVVSTGLYSVVRHPMYSGIVLIVLGTPIALGSWWAILMTSMIIGPLIWRLMAEEVFLKSKLPGYEAYCSRTKYRLVPGIW